MKHIERLGNEYAANWTRPPLPAEHQAALSGAYQAGFREARRLAADLLLNLPDHKTQMLTFVVKAIGEARVEDTEDA